MVGFRNDASETLIPKLCSWKLWFRSWDSASMSLKLLECWNGRYTSCDDIPRLIFKIWTEMNGKLLMNTCVCICCYTEQYKKIPCGLTTTTTTTFIHYGMDITPPPKRKATVDFRDHHGRGGIFGCLLQVATCRCPKARCSGLMEASKQKINLRVPPNPNFANETLEAEEPENLWYDIPRYYKVVKKIFILQLQHSIWYIVQNYSPLRPTQQVFCPEYCQLNTMPLDQGKNERNHTNFTCQSSFLPIKNRSNSQRPSPLLSFHPTVTHMQLCCVKDRFFRPFRSASCTSLKAKSQTVLSWEVVQVPRLHTRNRPGLIKASWAPAVFATYF